MAGEGDAWDRVHPELIDLMFRHEVVPDQDVTTLTEETLARTIFLAIELAEPFEQADIVSRIISEEEVEQVCFVVGDSPEADDVEVTPDGRIIFGSLGIGWRGEMGNRGFLSTGKLGTRVTGLRPTPSKRINHDPIVLSTKHKAALVGLDMDVGSSLLDD
ncbi:hypothetical protein NM208_g13190 [Fusarium decemcellulare]|uniref:Uncharacterized protein n=1 Tax=Fusarium decemcellulare TaxID=57161 RepID=A0ACC1RQ35_9HYPO|nr:hypothetical protein NM208_g13190 [Fusarium decemcellulare]